MSFIFRDGSIVPRARLNQATAAFSRFKKFWPTKVINHNGEDIPVYNKISNNVYLNGFVSDEVTKKFVKSLGMDWEDWISQDIDKEIETIYFELKPGYKWNGKLAYLDEYEMPVDSFEIPSKKEIVEYINSRIDNLTELNVTVHYGGGLGRYIREHELEWTATGSRIESGSLNKAQIRDVLESAPWYFLANTRNLPFQKNSFPYQMYSGGNDTLETYYKATDAKLNVATLTCTDNILGVLAPLDNGKTFSTDNVIIEEDIATKSHRNGEILQYSYTKKYIFHAVDENSYIVNRIYEWFDSYVNILELPFTPKDNDSKYDTIANSMDDSICKKVFRAMMVDKDVNLNNPITVADSLYLKVPNTDYAGRVTVYDYYLKVDSVNKMRKSDFVNMLSTSIDIGYTVEKKKWWEVVLFAAVIIIAIVVAVFTFQYYIASGTLVAVGAAATAASLTFTAGAFALSSLGGLSSANNVTVIGKFAQISGYVAAVTGVLSIYNNFVTAAAQSVREAGTEELKGAALDAAIDNLTIGDMVNFAVKSVTESVTNLVTGNVSFTEVASAISNTIKIVKQVNDFMIDKEKKKLENETNELAEEERKYNESIASNVFMQGYVSIELGIDSTAGYDAIESLNNDMNAKLLGTENFVSWYTSTHSSYA